ncbi:hypothetical protein H6P81_013144 [Aristolochia fimbriata]|uniref:Uncharacterized protein n=1 Tax=Aristolochia fimbriata TaxID=158543 RepID=A0AAV7EGZ9_ARIFI|nr:hypothetical protein H6P81_013144 [Aristolochia fimbriata]
MMVHIGDVRYVLGLLKRSLLSRSPLSDVFLLKKTNDTSSSSLDKVVFVCLTKNINSKDDTGSTSKLESHQYRCEDDDDLKKRSINVNVILNRATKNKLYRAIWSTRLSLSGDLEHTNATIGREELLKRSLVSKTLTDVFIPKPARSIRKSERLSGRKPAPSMYKPDKKGTRHNIR